MEQEWIQLGMLVTSVVAVALGIGAFAVSYFLLRSSIDPQVIVYTKHDDDQPTLLKIVIENIGKGVAYDVTFSISKSLPARAFGIESAPGRQAEPMTDGPLITGIPLLAPGERRVINWGQFGGITDAVGEAPIRVTARFSSKRQSPWDPADHTVESLLEVKSFEGTSAVASPAGRQARTLERLADQAEALKHALSAISEVITRPDREAALERLKARKLERTQTDDRGD